MRLRVIEGGSKLDVSEIKAALDEFRRATGAQINRSLFRNLWGMVGAFEQGFVDLALLRDLRIDTTIGDIEPTLPALSMHAAMGDATSAPDNRAIQEIIQHTWQESVYKRVAVRYSTQILSPIIEFARAGLDLESLRQAKVEQSYGTGN